MIEFRTDGTVAHITLDGDRLNVLSLADHEILHGHLRRFLNDDALKVAILSAAPGKAFSAGDNVKEQRPKRGEMPDWTLINGTTRRNKPIIGAVDGWCLGQGLIYLLLLTDLRYATPKAKFGFPEINWGMAGASGYVRLARQIAPVDAMYLALTGDYFSAEQAAAVRLINEVVPAEQLLGHAAAVAARIARHPRISIQTEMDASLNAQEMSKIEALSFSMDLYHNQRRLLQATDATAVPADFPALQQAK